MAQRNPSLDRLRAAIRACPAIDNHAHGLLRPGHYNDFPFEIIATEAEGAALKDTFKTLSHLRAERQLRELYNLPPDADWEAILAKRDEELHEDPEGLMRKCLQGIHCILIDDGLKSQEKLYDYAWHDRLTPAPTKRVVRIETIAETIMSRLLSRVTEDLVHDQEFLANIFSRFTSDFERKIIEGVGDEDVAAFKTVVCYRSGLHVEPDFNESLLKIATPFENYVSRSIRKRKYRIEKKALNDYLVLKTLEVLAESGLDDGNVKPLQFHCGLGDADISLRQSNPAYLQPLIEQYPSVPFVLLHSAYPYTREAGYLATVFKHVYLDLGEIFPMLSRDGQVSVIRQALELVPGGKLLFSTDARFFPENYWLSNRQFREALEEVLVDYVQKKDITESQAFLLCKDILFNNSNMLYNLRHPLNLQQTIEDAQKTIAFHSKRSPKSYDEKTFEDFRGKNPTVSFVYVQWVDYMGTNRTRILPIVEFERLIKTGERIGISRGNMGTLQNDTITPVVDTCGQIYIEPDLSTLRPTHPKDPLPSATVLAFWRDEEGSALRECPRGGLQLLLEDLQYDHSISLLIGFEIEVTFIKFTASDPDQPHRYEPITKNHAWGTLSPEQWRQMPFLTEIITSLAHMGINVQQFHAESGPGQYEFILPPLPPLAAIDTLIQARQAIVQIAASHDYRATLHPQPFPGLGTAAHAHISLDPPDEEMSFWVAGVLSHLEAICAFTLPETASYSRVADGNWTGGSWVAWGTQNRECPLRKITTGHWEVRSLDGMANMYLAMLAVIGAGLLGLKESPGIPEEALHAKDCRYDPSRLSDEQRNDLGIERRLPMDLHEALDALQHDTPLREILPVATVSNYMTMKRVEQDMLDAMSEDERRIWLIERY